MEIPNKLGYMGLLLRDEVKAGDTELGFIIREVGVKTRGVAEISQGVGVGGMKELKTGHLPRGGLGRKNERQHRFLLKCWQEL